MAVFISSSSSFFTLLNRKYRRFPIFFNISVVNDAIERRLKFELFVFSSEFIVWAQSVGVKIILIVGPSFITKSLTGNVVYIEVSF